MKRAFAAAIITAALLGLSIAPAAATASKKVSVQMSLKDLIVPGAFAPNDELRLTVNVLVGGKPAKQGDVNLITNDPKEPELCGIIQPPRKLNYCNIDFPNAGHFTITAEYEPIYNFPSHYKVISRLAVAIEFESATTTTTTTPASANYNVFLVANSPIANGLPIGQSLSVSALVTNPQNPKVAPAGTVTFANNGVPIASCRNVALVPNEGNGIGPAAYLSAANCTLAFSVTGLFTLTATVAVSTGAPGTLGVYVIP